MLYESIKPARGEDTFILEKMLIVAEDHRFYYHFGIDFIGIIRAIYRNKIFYKKQGASTIEQQLVRTLLQEYDRTYCRKVREVLLATTISIFIPKKEIPLLYLSVAYYGKNLLGYESIRSYLKLEGPLDAMAAAEIVSRIKYPQSIQNNIKNEKISSRIKYILYKFEKSSV
jgi:membrane carboxypeptidase/penicillin-binding protein